MINKSRKDITFVRWYSKRMASFLKKLTGFYITHSIMGYDEQGAKVVKDLYSFEQPVLTAI